MSGGAIKPKVQYADLRVISVPRPENLIRPGKLFLEPGKDVDEAIKREYLDGFCVPRSLMATPVVKDKKTGQKVAVSFLEPGRQRSLTLALTKVMSSAGLKTLEDLITAIDEHDECLLKAPADLITVLIPPRDATTKTITDFDLLDMWVKGNSVEDETGQLSLRPGLFELLPLGDQYIALLRDRGLSRRWRVKMLSQTLQLPSTIDYLEIKLGLMAPFVSLLSNFPELDATLKVATSLVNFINNSVTGNPGIKGVTIIGLYDLCGLKDVSGKRRLMDMVVKMLLAQGISPKNLAEQLRMAKMAEASRVCLPLLTKELEQLVEWFNKLEERYEKALGSYGDEPDFDIFVKRSREAVGQQKRRLLSLIEQQQATVTLLKQIVEHYGKQSIMYIPESALGVAETKVVDHIKTISLPEHWTDDNLTAHLLAIALRNLTDCMVQAEERIRRSEAAKLQEERRQQQQGRTKLLGRRPDEANYGGKDFRESHFKEIHEFDRSKLKTHS